MERLTTQQLDALEAARKAAKLPDSMRILSATISLHPQGPDLCSTDQHEEYIALAHNALPALLAEIRELRALTTPEPIGEKHRDGNWWLVWDSYERHWCIACFGKNGRWGVEGDIFYHPIPTYALPLPPAPEEAHNV